MATRFKTLFCVLDQEGVEPLHALEIVSMQDTHFRR